ncbi:translation machinery-associated protein 16 [Purpureocillium takamizusanense]|uniref:Translation machinery-associated protein 16 n=1 Tax=Purpureocillium takamizusanense TaxID=2060973 RepID=A0A9Q8QDL9_9HYPO|nr:translation machinery-associated protein 16 [Purpureocillium takamizusanense]UNI17700.1 translation machinery-associated protein 16 [Purpureocillium takamizusanense]
MPSSLSKTRKQIAKKRNGEVNALHEKSRDSLRLHKAGVRDLRLQKLAEARSKKEQPIGVFGPSQGQSVTNTDALTVDRVAFFQERLKGRDDSPVDVATAQQFVEEFIRQYDEEYDSLKKTRRPGRPGSAREDLLKMKIAALRTEFKNGFVIPDIIKEENAKLLVQWEGSWARLTTLPWIKMSSAGSVRQADFPNKGIN